MALMITEAEIEEYIRHRNSGVRDFQILNALGISS
jgi:hypothetical protein